MPPINNQALRAARIAAGFNLTTAATSLNISKGYLHDLETGRSSMKRRPALLSQIAKLYHVRATDLTADAQDAA